MSFAVVALLAASCGLETSGQLSATATPGDDAAAPAETGAPGNPDLVDGGAGASLPPAPPQACTTASGACVASLEAGWTPFAYASSRAQACPANYVSSDLVTTPIASAGACTCACSISPNDPPTCAKGTFQGLVGSTSCTSTGVTYVVDGTGCTNFGGGAMSAYARFVPFPLTKGTCTGSVTKDATKATGTPTRACAPPTECLEDLCSGKSPTGFGSCIVHDGDVPCPATGPFTSKTLVGSGVDLTCDGCATCENQAACGVATLRYYNDPTCTTEVASRVVDNQCNGLASGVAGQNTQRFRYDVATNSPKCNMTSTPTTATALAQARTVCCR